MELNLCNILWFWKINSAKSSVCSVTSRCPPDYSVTDKTAPHKFLFWPQDRVNHQPGQGAASVGLVLWFGSNILVMALFRVQGWHRLDGCPVLHLMVSLECPYFLVVLGNISKLCWLHLVFDESLSTLAIDQNRQSFSPRQQYYSVTLCVSSNPLQTAQYFQNVLKYFLVGWIFHDSMIAQCQVLNPRLDILWRRDWSQAAPVFVLVAPSLIGCYN